MLKLVKNISVSLNHKGKEIIDKKNVVSTIFEDEGWYDIPKEVLINYLEETSLNFNIRSFTRFKKFEEKLLRHPKTSNHNSIKSLFIKNGIHNPDWQICLDAQMIWDQASMT